MSEKLEKAKIVIRENYEHAEFGIFDCGNLVGDSMGTLYDDGDLVVLICREYGYFEVFGLTDEEFSELAEFYGKGCIA